MTSSSRAVLQWSPRILGMVVSLFLGAFALDAVGEGILAFLLHATPALLLLLVVAASWRREWLGGVVFIALAGFYAMMAWSHPDWVLMISGPLLLVGVLFLLSWREHRGGGLADLSSAT